MKTITCKQLRQLIADVLSVNIDEMRATKDNQFFYEFDVAPTDEEVDAFIISSEYFDEEIKEFLLSEVGCLVVENEWRKSLEKTLFWDFEFVIN